MSTATENDIPRDTVETIQPGDAVELAIDSYEWSNPLDVVDADDPVEWDVPYGVDWWMRTIYLEGGNGAEYAIVYSTISTPARVECYRAEDDELGDKRGSVEHLALVDNQDDEDEHAVGDELPADVNDEDDAETTDTETEVALPDDVTKSDVATAADDHETLGKVADALGLTPGRARTVLFHLGHYGKVQDVVTRPGGGRR